MNASPAPHRVVRRVVTADGSATLYSERYAQPFASVRGALSEARHVFLAGSGVEARLAAGKHVRVLEVGFGTGLNFFITAQACTGQPQARLEYMALEHTLLDGETLTQLGYGALVDHELVTAYLEWRAALGVDPAPGSYVFERGRVRLELLLGDAAAQPLPLLDVGVAAVYHDAFSPVVNPELWTEAFLARLAGALGAGGVIVSYCVQGAVRRRLEALGLVVSKRPGPPGGKREVLVARRAEPGPGA